MMKQSLEKRLTLRQGATQKPLTALEIIPAELSAKDRQESRESSSRIGYI
ncbi:MAG: hypothetical protein RMY64_05020 [Nostoc sp. DedQUE08]|nr:hypothetical protein [Nostoc sp. DedQUE08]MDZ8064989.1 hypothetical protein [Nostoc sp. DedQUE08]